MWRWVWKHSTPKSLCRWLSESGWISYFRTCKIYSNRRTREKTSWTMEWYPYSQCNIKWTFEHNHILHIWTVTQTFQEVSSYDGTPLLHAAECGHLHIVKYLTNEQGCNPSHLSKDMLTSLHCATWKRYMDIAKFFTVEKHCDPCNVHRFWSSHSLPFFLLHFAARWR